ncbi:hypothetical protein XAC3810_780130 [Xanthomonas citri pv. citri]|uniref:Uncharacterized protein n=1 Tax=Xanthomonas citri pv. citri TaxID=611301 RepID=A0A0U5BZE9_XANCI|nr:hypothetical protein XAC902_1090005 [Xanthomonas citri pv. citri]CEE41386.1 hypothetical protein XAC3824_930080 [Xanthomonas citri pv. citri]CEE41429.1 hypothetical protein XAC9322_750129 [Xanthomonas citri pv. citri]CEE42981.1 hypothetical protein XAC1083_790081 [Xanthomonas citri pv. citri]CEE48580.1 hypothetical protein XAC3810_780130 [Xanthomonas citri pv. citri]
MHVPLSALKHHDQFNTKIIFCHAMKGKVLKNASCLGCFRLFGGRKLALRIAGAMKGCEDRHA